MEYFLQIYQRRFDYLSHDLLISKLNAYGTSVRPLLFNIFLCDLFLIMENIDIASYADDKMPYNTENSIEEVI